MLAYILNALWYLVENYYFIKIGFLVCHKDKIFTFGKTVRLSIVDFIEGHSLLVYFHLSFFK